MYRFSVSTRHSHPVKRPRTAGSSSLSGQDSKIREANNRRLRQAINYLISEGGPDTFKTYRERVRKIDEHILRLYVDEGYPHDHDLYRELRAMVRAQEEDFARNNQEDVSRSSGSGDEVEALHREDDLRDNQQLVSPKSYHRRPQPASASKRPTSPSTHGFPGPSEEFASLEDSQLRSRTRKPDDPVREKHFKYGGPHNEAEHWHKDLPADLPFGETIYMQELESLKIKYDLQKSADNSVDDDPIVNATVPYAAAERNAKSVNHYDSGSKFKLPKPSKTYSQWLYKHGDDRQIFNLKEVVDEFNKGGDEEEQVKKDYVPRVFLEQILVPGDEISDSRSSLTSSVRPTYPSEIIGRRGSISQDAGGDYASRTSDIVGRYNESLEEMRKWKENRTGAAGSVPSERAERLPTAVPGPKSPAKGGGLGSPKTRQQVASPRRPGRPPTVRLVPPSVASKRKSGDAEDGHTNSKNAKASRTPQSTGPKKVAFAAPDTDDGDGVGGTHNYRLRSREDS